LAEVGGSYEGAEKISIIYAGTYSAHKLQPARSRDSRIQIPDQSASRFPGLQYYNSNLCSHEGTLFTRTFLSTAGDWVELGGEYPSVAGHSLSGKWKTRRLAAETEMKPNGTRKTNLQNENATHTRGEVGASGWKTSIPTVFVWRFACHRVRRIQDPQPSPYQNSFQMLLTHQISLLSPWLPLVLFIAFLTLFFGTRRRLFFSISPSPGPNEIEPTHEPPTQKLERREKFRFCSTQTAIERPLNEVAAKSIRNASISWSPLLS